MRIESLERRAAFLEETLTNIRQYIDIIASEEEEIKEKVLENTQSAENTRMSKIEAWIFGFYFEKKQINSKRCLYFGLIRWNEKDKKIYFWWI